MRRVMSVDLEYDYETKSDLGLSKVLPRLIDLFKKYDVKATFFVLGEIAEKHPEVIKKLAKDFEIASHSYDHPDMSRISYEEAEMQIAKSKAVFEKLGIKVKGFRAPFFRPHKNQLELLKKQGYTYDASFSSSHPPCFVNPFVKTKPYLDTKTGVIEFPLSQFFWKMVPTGFFYYRFLYPWTKMFKSHYIFYLHPHELLDAEQSNLSWWRRIFYGRYLGERGFAILEEYLKDSKENGIEWVTCSNYLKHITAKSNP